MPRRSWEDTLVWDFVRRSFEVVGRQLNSKRLQYDTEVVPGDGRLRIRFYRGQERIEAPAILQPYSSEIIDAARRAQNYFQRSVLLVDPATQTVVVRLYGDGDVRHDSSRYTLQQSMVGSVTFSFQSLHEI